MAKQEYMADWGLLTNYHLNKIPPFLSNSLFNQRQEIKSNNF